MQRIFHLILLLCCATAAHAQSLKGDMDADGRLTVADVRLLSRALTVRYPEADALAKGDMDTDGRLSIIDLVRLIDAALKFKEPAAYPLPYESAAASEDDWILADGQKGVANPWLKGTKYVQATGYQAWEGGTKKSNREVDGYLISPAFCTKSSTGTVTMSFDDVLRYTDKDADYANHLRIFVSSTSNGTAFVPAEWTELSWRPEHINASNWDTSFTEIPLPAEFVGQDRVRIAFWFYAPAAGSTTFEFLNFKIREGEPSEGTDDPIVVNPDDLNSNTVSLAGSYVKTETGTMSSTYIGRIEMPRLCSDDTFIVHQDTELSGSPVNYSIAYSEAKRHSHWVAFRFDDEVGCKTTTRSGSFKRDPLISTSLQVPTSYPTGSGYDRGHLAASNDRTATETSNGQTFYMTNMSPQLASFNQVYWQKYENHLLSLVRASTNTVPTDYRKAFADTVYVVKGGTIDDDKLNGYLTMTDGFKEPIPKFYYMALLKVKDGKYSAIGFWMEHKEYPKIDSKNTKAEILAHCVTIDELERLTGIDFFCNLPASIETVVEASFTASDWEL